MDAKLIAMGAGGLAGLLVGCGSWGVAGGKNAGSAVADIDARLTAVHTRVRGPASAQSEALSQALASPLFVVSAGQVELKEVGIRLQGIVKTPRRTAALLSIDGGSAEWWVPGQERGGVVLEHVSTGGIQVSTPLGVREINLGQQPISSSTTAPSDGPPPGFKSPPPPASAPGAD